MRHEMAEQPEVLARIVDQAGEIRDRVRAVVPSLLDGICFCRARVI